MASAFGLDSPRMHALDSGVLKLSEPGSKFGKVLGRRGTTRDRVVIITEIPAHIDEKFPRFRA